MLRAVVSERQDDCNDYLPAVLSAYWATPDSSTGLSPHRMVYGAEMNMPVDLAFGEVGQERPAVHWPRECAEWLRGSIRDAHTLARTNLKKAAKRQKRGYGESSRTVSFQRGDWVWCTYPPVCGGKFRYQKRWPWLVLTKTGPVTYKIQRHAEADPEIIHVDKLLPYQADLGEDLQIWLQDTESKGHRVIGTQTCDHVPSDPEPEIFPDFTTEDKTSFSECDSENWANSDPEDEELSTPEMPPRCGQRPRLAPDHYNPVNRVFPANRAPYDVTTCSFRRMS